MANYDAQRDYNPTNKVKFTMDNVDKFVIDHGAYTVWERSYLCPCRNKETNAPSSSCERCMGTGFSYYESKSTLVMYQSQDKGVTNGDVSLAQPGTAIGTTTKEDLIGFRDRLTLTESVIPQSVLIYVTKKAVESGIYLRYDVQEVVYARTDDEELPVGSLNVKDNFFYPTEDMVGKYVSMNLEVTLRYYVVDILREARYQYETDARQQNASARGNKFFRLTRKLLLRREDMYVPDVLSDIATTTQDQDLVDPKLGIQDSLGGLFGG